LLSEVASMTVLVGFDGSKASTEALRWAGRYAAALDERLHVVRAWQYPASTVLPLPARDPLPAPDEMEWALRKEMDAAVAETVADQRMVSTELVRGSAAGYLVDRASRPTIRALVVGSRGLGGFAGLVLGSVTRACLSHAASPVVVVPEGYDASTPLGRVLVGLDGSEGATVALRWACETTRILDARLVAASVFVPDQAELRPDIAAELWARAESDLLRWCTESADRRPEQRVLSGDPRAALLEVIDREEFDLAVVGSRGRGPVSRLLLGSVADALAHHSTVPVAVVPSGRGD
jgi:nucleotide-binding universal stress UspA family protein